MSRLQETEWNTGGGMAKDVAVDFHLLLLMIYRMCIINLIWLTYVNGY